MERGAIVYTMNCEALKYEGIIYWSEGDATFIAEAPELSGCAAAGPTPPATLRWDHDIC
jgi:hypothetical protein